jgi:3-methylfumaryl-CoA hydratase
MWASGSVSFHGRLAPAGLRRSSRIASVQHKTGRTGPVAFVHVEHQVTTGSAALVERQVLAYREPADARAFGGPGAIAAPGYVSMSARLRFAA